MSEPDAPINTLSPESYNETPYPGLSYAQTHPDRLASMATLLGLEPPPVEHCRVLEIGCAVGSNLLPMAENMPGSEFVGIDYAAKQIEIGRGNLAEFGFDNLRLEHMDLMEMPESFGEFDYIIAHGLYSWVPPVVRDRLFTTIRRHLSANGVAYVSYNTYPGWYMLRAVRDGMLLRARHLTDPAERAAAGHEIIDFLARALPEDSGPFGNFVNSYRDVLEAKLAEGPDGGDSLLLHDEMSEINDPVYFEQFVEHAGRFDLQYLSEVDLASSMPGQLDPEFARDLGQLAGDPREAEQWLDFISFRTFRQTLLVHQEANVQTRLRPQVVSRFKVASLTRPEDDEIDLSPGVVQRFKGGDVALFSTDHPLTKAAFLEMIENRPVAIPFETLTRAAAARIGLEINDQTMPEVNTWAANALRALSYSRELIELHVFQPPMSIRPGPRPETTRVMRWQASKGFKATNLRHERVEFDPVLRVLTQLLDGRHDVDQIHAYFMTLHEQGKFLLPERLLEKASAGEIVRRQLEGTLTYMGRAGMLKGE